MLKISLALILSFLFLSLYAFAQTPDNETPAVEDVCDGLYEAEYGLCNAYCEALDCDSDAGYEQHSKACDKVLANFLKKSGGVDPPCEGAECIEITDPLGCDENINCFEPFSCEGRIFCCPPDPLPFYTDP